MTELASRMQSELSANPQKCLDSIISQRLLKRDIRDELSSFIVANQDRPEIAELFWVMLLPHRLSVVSVEG